MDPKVFSPAGTLFAICASLMLAASAMAHDGCGAGQSSVSYFGPFDVEVGDAVTLRLVVPPTSGVTGRDKDSARDSAGVPVTVRFFGANGGEVATMSRRLAPGAIDSVELSGRIVPPDGTGRTSLWATLTVDSEQGRKPTGQAVAVQLEITDSEGSQFLSPATLVGFNPQPEPPGHY